MNLENEIDNLINELLRETFDITFDDQRKTVLAVYKHAGLHYVNGCELAYIKRLIELAFKYNCMYLINTDPFRTICEFRFINEELKLDGEAK